MKSTFFIVPGFKQKATYPQFRWLVKLLEDKGFNIVKVPIVWNYRVMSDYASDFIEFYGKHKTSTNYVLGFSYGAVITLITANELNPEKIYLCSLSPDFKEDLENMDPLMKQEIGKRRIEDSKKRSGRKLAKNLMVPSVVFYGGVEGKKYPQLKVRCEETAKLANRSKLIIVREAPHDISHPKYKKSIEQELSRL